MSTTEQPTDEQPASPDVAASPHHKTLCACLVEAGKLDPGTIERACLLQLEQNAWEPIGSILVKLGLVSERDIAEGLSIQLDMPLVERAAFPEEQPIDQTISYKFLRENKALIQDETEDSLTVVMADPQDQYVIDALKLFSGKEVVTRIGIPSEIDRANEQRQKNLEATDELSDRGDDLQYLDDVEQLKELASEAPVIKLVNQIIHGAVESGASDIHIEPFENTLKLRYRIDGLLREVEPPPVRSTAAVISRIKIMANLNIAERRLAQDGRSKVRVRGKEIDMRISTVPTMHGESLVLRLLHRESVVLDFESLGFNHDIEQQLTGLLANPHGILLVTGPTGSGKSTTLYTALTHLNTAERKIITVEDPVEYNIDGINQIQVKSQIGLTFASALRSIVRQDPDVIMIGEMRDRETAAIAVQSALTGHLVLSTLHTNDAAGSITRLNEMGIEHYLLTSTINGILAQRLVRKLCSHCKEQYTPLDAIIEQWDLRRFSDGKPITLYRPVGCEHCGNTGYSGRNTIAELLIMTDAIKRQVLQHADAGQIANQAIADGMLTMLDDGLRKALQGITSLEEVQRVTQEQAQSQTITNEQPGQTLDTSDEQQGLS